MACDVRQAGLVAWFPRVTFEKATRVFVGFTPPEALGVEFNDKDVLRSVPVTVVPTTWLAAHVSGAVVRPHVGAMAVTVNAAEADSAACVCGVWVHLIGFVPTASVEVSRIVPNTAPVGVGVIVVEVAGVPLVNRQVTDDPAGSKSVPESVITAGAVALDGVAVRVGVGPVKCGVAARRAERTWTGPPEVTAPAVSPRIPRHAVAARVMAARVRAVAAGRQAAPPG